MKVRSFLAFGRRVEQKWFDGWWSIIITRIIIWQKQGELGDRREGMPSLFPLPDRRQQ